MPIQFPDFKRISFDEANPALVGAERGQKFMQNIMQFPQDLQAKILANKIAEVKANYAKPMAQQELTKAIQENQYNPKIWESEIGLRGSQSGLAEATAANTRFLTKNPAFINPDAALFTQAQQWRGSGNGMNMPPVSTDVSGGATEFGAVNQASPQEVQNIADNGNRMNGMNGINPPQKHYSQSQYHPDAMAFNPPNLPSPTGNPLKDNMYYKRYGMSPVDQARLDLAKSQAEKYQTENIDRNKEMGSQAVFANESVLNAYKFLDALKRSTSLERGVVGGNTAAVSDAAQEMDTSGANMAAAATKLFQGKNAVHQSDIALQHEAKPNRKQNQDVSFDLAHGVIAKGDRMKEQEQFYARGTQLGLRTDLLDAMWNKYETDRPYIDPETKMPNDAYKGTWQDYLHPEVVNSFLAGKTYNIPDQKKLEKENWTTSDLKKIKEWAKANGKNPKDVDKKTLFRLAQNHKTTLSEVKKEFIKNGILK